MLKFSLEKVDLSEEDFHYQIVEASTEELKFGYGNA
jgi:hypothetical protein